MKTICLVFQVHQPVMLTRYRFFDIGNHHSYYDEHANGTNLKNLAKTCYLPANNLLLKQINSQGGRLKVAFYLSGVTLDQLKVFTPEVYDSFAKLADTGCTEFITGTFSNSLSSLRNEDAFRQQVKDHRVAMIDLTGKTSDIFFNTGLIYDDELGANFAGMGFKGIITEGTRQVLGWKSPNSLYANAFHPTLNVLFRNSELSQDFFQHFSDETRSEYPLTPQKYLSRILSLREEDSLINLVMPYETFGNIREENSGIFHFLDHFLFLASHSPELQFSTPTEIIESRLPESMIQIPHPVSWDCEKNNISEWTTNELQQEALLKLYELTTLMTSVSDPYILLDWKYLQTADHFRYMSTTHLSMNQQPGDNPYGSPFNAFINYMNILNDFKIRLHHHSKK
jgi:alpha-amylase